MNCREAQSQIFAERDSALNNAPRATLDGHLAHCDACRRIRDDLAAALTTWRDDAREVRVPDADREWHAVRRMIRGGVKPGAERAARSRRSLVPWLALPLGAAAALALAFFVRSSSPEGGGVRFPTAQVARANSIEVPGNGASTMVFVDDKSGWLFVMASDATSAKRS